MIRKSVTKKIFNDNQDDAIRFSVRLSENLWLKSQKIALDEGHSARGINKWIIDALHTFIELPQSIQTQIILDVSLHEIINTKTNSYGLRMKNELKEKLWLSMMQAAWSGKDASPPIMLEPTISMVIKAAIIYQISRKDAS